MCEYHLASYRLVHPINRCDDCCTDGFCRTVNYDHRAVVQVAHTLLGVTTALYDLYFNGLAWQRRRT